MAEITMYDSIDLNQIPASAPAVAGYVNGAWPTFGEIAARFPHAYRLSIAVNTGADADCLDVEIGDASPGDAPGWFSRQTARGLARPVIYANASTMSQIISVMNAARAPRSSMRLWSAHYTGTAHICGPGSCGALGETMDGTQWTDTALGRNLDESLLAADFFGSVPSPVPAWQEAMMRALPTISTTQNNDDAHLPHWLIHRIQLVVNGIFHASPQLKVDGVYGPVTAAAVAKIQTGAGLVADGICGPATWALLVGVQ